MKIGDLVKYLPDCGDFGTDMFGIIEEIETCDPSDHVARIWVRWFDSADLNWAEVHHLEVRSEAR